MYAQGMRTMYEESLKGLLPIMPGVEIPETLSHEHVCSISIKNGGDLFRFIQLIYSGIFQSKMVQAVLRFIDQYSSDTYWEFGDLDAIYSQYN